MSDILLFLPVFLTIIAEPQPLEKEEKNLNLRFKKIQTHPKFIWLERRGWRRHGKRVQPVLPPGAGWGRPPACPLSLPPFLLALCAPCFRGPSSLPAVLSGRFSRLRPIGVGLLRRRRYCPAGAGLRLQRCASCLYSGEQTGLYLPVTFFRNTKSA
jgi:hypothetical protein